MEEYSREPCPWRIIDDCGGAFTMGLIGGSLFNGIQGFRHAPSGFNRRTMGGLVRLKERAPVLGGQFAAWGLCFADKIISRVMAGLGTKDTTFMTYDGVNV